jgi:hypothetical protein
MGTFYEMTLPVASYDVAWQRYPDDNGIAATREALDLHIKSGVPNTLITTKDNKTVVEVQITFADPPDPSQIGFVHDHGSRATVYVTIPTAEFGTVLAILHAKPQATVICGLYDGGPTVGYFNLLTSTFSPVMS